MYIYVPVFMFILEGFIVQALCLLYNSICAHTGTVPLLSALQQLGENLYSCMVIFKTKFL